MIRILKVVWIWDTLVWQSELPCGILTHLWAHWHNGESEGLQRISWHWTPEKANQISVQTRVYDSNAKQKKKKNTLTFISCLFYLFLLGNWGKQRVPHGLWYFPTKEPSFILLIKIIYYLYIRIYRYTVYTHIHSHTHAPTHIHILYTQMYTQEIFCPTWQLFFCFSSPLKRVFFLNSFGINQMKDRDMKLVPFKQILLFL